MNNTAIISADTATPILQNISTSDVIQICSIVVALILGAISIIVSVVAYRQNAKIFKESNMAYVFAVIHKIYGDSIPYIKIANHGNSTAHITDIHILDANAPELASKPFAPFVNCVLAPKQKHLIVYHSFREDIDLTKIYPEFDLEIKYRTLDESVSQICHINFNIESGLFDVMPKTKDPVSALNNINQSIQGVQRTLS